MDLVREQQEERDQAWAQVLEDRGPTLSFLSGNDHDEVIARLVRRGFPRKERSRIWRHLARVDCLMAAHPNRYADLCFNLDSLDNTSRTDIAKDLNRTFPGHPGFNGTGEYRAKLERVLGAYALHNPDMGYCQGMNYVLGLILLVTDTEETAFWCFATLMEAVVPGYFAPSLTGALVDIRVVQALLLGAQYNSVLGLSAAAEVFTHDDLHMLCSGWLLTLFVNAFTAETALVVLDNYFFEGNSSVTLRTALALIKLNEQDIIDADSCLILKPSSTTLFTDPLALMETGYALLAHISAQCLVKLRAESRLRIHEQRKHQKHFVVLMRMQAFAEMRGIESKRIAILPAVGRKNGAPIQPMFRPQRIAVLEENLWRVERDVGMTRVTHSMNEMGHDLDSMPPLDTLLKRYRDGDAEVIESVHFALYEVERLRLAMAEDDVGKTIYPQMRFAFDWLNFVHYCLCFNLQHVFAPMRTFMQPHHDIRDGVLLLSVQFEEIRTEILNTIDEFEKLTESPSPLDVTVALVRRVALTLRPPEEVMKQGARLTSMPVDSALCGDGDWAEEDTTRAFAPVLREIQTLKQELGIPSGRPGVPHEQSVDQTISPPATPRLYEALRDGNVQQCVEAEARRRRRARERQSVSAAEDVASDDEVTNASAIRATSTTPAIAGLQAAIGRRSVATPPKVVFSDPLNESFGSTCSADTSGEDIPGLIPSPSPSQIPIGASPSGTPNGTPGSTRARRASLAVSTLRPSPLSMQLAPKPRPLSGSLSGIPPPVAARVYPKKLSFAGSPKSDKRGRSIPALTEVPATPPAAAPLVELEIPMATPPGGKNASPSAASLSASDSGFLSLPEMPATPPSFIKQRFQLTRGSSLPPASKLLIDADNPRRASVTGSTPRPMRPAMAKELLAMGFEPGRSSRLPVDGGALLSWSTRGRTQTEVAGRERGHRSGRVWNNSWADTPQGSYSKRHSMGEGIKKRSEEHRAKRNSTGTYRRPPSGGSEEDSEHTRRAVLFARLGALFNEVLEAYHSFVADRKLPSILKVSGVPCPTPLPPAEIRLDESIVAIPRLAALMICPPGDAMPLPVNFHGVLYQARPSFPGVRDAITSLGILCGLRPSEPSMLLRVSSGFSDAPVEACRQRGGEPLSELLRRRPEACRDIDPKTFSSLFILSLLVDRGEERDGQYIVVRDTVVETCAEGETGRRRSRARARRNRLKGRRVVSRPMATSTPLKTATSDVHSEPDDFVSPPEALSPGAISPEACDDSDSGSSLDLEPCRKELLNELSGSGEGHTERRMERQKRRRSGGMSGTPGGQGTGAATGERGDERPSNANANGNGNGNGRHESSSGAGTSGGSGPGTKELRGAVYAAFANQPLNESSGSLASFEGSGRYRDEPAAAAAFKRAAAGSSNQLKSTPKSSSRTTRERGVWRLVGVNYGNCFVDPVTTTPAGARVALHDELFVMPAMAEAIHPDVASRVLDLRGEYILPVWLDALRERNEEYKKLQGKGLFTKDELRDAGLPLRFVDGTVARIYRRLLRLQSRLEEAVPPTHDQLLRLLNPLVADRYAQAREMCKHPLEALECVHDPARPAAASDEPPTTTTGANRILRRYNVADGDYLGHRYQTPEKAAAELIACVDLGGMTPSRQRSFLLQVKGTSFLERLILRHVGPQPCAVDDALLQNLRNGLPNLTEVWLDCPLDNIALSGLQEWQKKRGSDFTLVIRPSRAIGLVSWTALLRYGSLGIIFAENNVFKLAPLGEAVVMGSLLPAIWSDLTKLLHMAVQTNDVSTVAFLLSEVRALGSIGGRAEASVEGDLVAKFVDSTMFGSRSVPITGATPLQMAVANGNVDMAATLLAHGASLTLQELPGSATPPSGGAIAHPRQTPLQVAAMRGDIPMLRCLMAAHAARGVPTTSVLRWAEENKKNDIIHEMLDARG